MHLGAVSDGEVFYSEGNNDAETCIKELSSRMDYLAPQLGPDSRRELSDPVINPGLSSAHEATTATASAFQVTKPMRQYIRRNPRDIDTLVSLWRFGSKEEGFRPVHKFDTSKKQKNHLHELLKILSGLQVVANARTLGTKSSSQK